MGATLDAHDVAALYAAFNAREIDVLLARMTPDVDWANGYEGGRVHGVEAVRAYWTAQFEQIDGRVEPVGVTTAPDGRVRVDVHQVVHDRAGRLLGDRMVVHVYTVSDDGRIARMEIEEPAS
jgi:hypothetical protein